MKTQRFPELAKKLKALREDVIAKKKAIIEISRKTPVKGSIEKNIALNNANISRKNASREFRYFHVAYCELRGKTRSEIENVHVYNTHELDEKRINDIKFRFGSR